MTFSYYYRHYILHDFILYATYLYQFIFWSKRYFITSRNCIFGTSNFREQLKLCIKMLSSDITWLEYGEKHNNSDFVTFRDNTFISSLESDSALICACFQLLLDKGITVSSAYCWVYNSLQVCTMLFVQMRKRRDLTLFLAELRKLCYQF